MSFQADDATFADLVGPGSGDVLVDFWSPWCAPCIALERVIEAVISARGDDRIRVARVDITVAPAVCDRYDVSTVPTLLLFCDGQPVRKIFARRQRQLAAELDELVG